MGSSISLSVLKYKPDVKFVVADCGFTNLYDLMHTGYSGYHVGFITPIVNAICRIRYGFNLKDTSAIDAIRNSEVPICFVHGGDDTFIVPDNSENLAKAHKGYDEVHIVDGAGHAESMKTLSTDGYSKLIDEFWKFLFPKNL